MKEEKKEEKTARRILAVVLIAFLALFFLFNLLGKPKTYSDSENRLLTQRPQLTGQDVLDGSYTEQFEQFESDQFFARPLFREISVLFSRAGGNREENGVVRGRGGQLFAEIAPTNDAVIKTNTEAINSFAADNEGVRTRVLLIPDAAQILSSQVPSRVGMEDQSKMFGVVRSQLDDTVVWMDAASVLSAHTDEKLYYQTDAHWTTQAAYDVFLETAPLLGISTPASTVYEANCAANDFKGELARDSGFLPTKTEEVDVYFPEEKTSYLVTDGDTGEVSPSIYDADALDGWNKYDVFLGDASFYEIETASESDRVLLVVKDSFADCYIPFLIPHFAKIIVVDAASYESSGGDLVDTYGVTDALFLFEGNEFLTDTDLSGLSE